MYCPSCGTELEAGSRFCHVCGKQIDDVSAEDAEVSEETRFVADDDLDFGMDSSLGSLGGTAGGSYHSMEDYAGTTGGKRTDTMLVSLGGQQGVAYVAADAVTGQAAAQNTGKSKKGIVAIVVALVAIAAIAAIAFFALRPQVGADARYTIQYETDGGTAIAATQASEGSQVTSPTNPTKDGYDFEGWYTDADRTEMVSFPFTASEDTILYAKWTEKPASSGDSGANNTANTNGGNTANTNTAQPAQTSTPQTSAPQNTQSNYYILPDSASRYLSRGDVSSLSNDDLSRAMNEIWARHGRRFNNNWLQSYFNSMSWYQGTIAADDFNHVYKGTDIESRNAEMINAILTERGYDVNKVHPN